MQKEHTYTEDGLINGGGGGRGAYIRVGLYRNNIPYLPVYNAHFFHTNFASKIEMRIIHGTFCFYRSFA